MGYFGIGIENIKNEVNYGTLFRSAQIFGASYIFTIGNRFKKQSSDTTKSWKNIPTFNYKTIEDFNNNRPYNCPLIGIELDSKTHKLSTFIHPKQCCYLLGAEDHGLSKEAYKYCQTFIVLPGKVSLNVSVAGSIVMYDRISKELV